jgi:cell cycle checkpoint protein
MATVTLTEGGLTVTVEEARTLVAVAFIFAQVFDDFDVVPPKRTRQRSPQVIVPDSDTEEEDELPEPGPAPRTPRAMQQDEEGEDEVVPENYTTAFQINLNVLVDCLNIFGTAGPVTAPSATTHKKWTKPVQGGGGAEDNQNSDGGEGPPRRGSVNGGGRSGQRDLQPVRLGGQMGDKKTSVRLTYSGDGYPLVAVV